MKVEKKMVLYSPAKNATCVSHTYLTRPSNTTNEEETIISRTHQLVTTISTRYSSQNHLSQRTSQQLGLEPSTDASFNQLKQWICNTLLKTTLAYYDHTKPVEIHTDASEYGFGLAIMQNNTQ